jgi:hypothetical protein
MDLVTLLKRIPRDLLMHIAVEYVGGWKKKDGKIVFDFTYLYGKIPKIKYIQNNYLVYSRQYIYVKELSFNCELKISEERKYILSYWEEREYREHEYEVNALTQKIHVYPKCGTLDQRIYLDILDIDCQKQEIMESLWDDNNGIIITNNQ